MAREVKFYETEAGQSPVEKFLDTLSAKQAMAEQRKRDYFRRKKR